MLRTVYWVEDSVLCKGQCVVLAPLLSVQASGFVEYSEMGNGKPLQTMIVYKFCFSGKIYARLFVSIISFTFKLQFRQQFSYFSFFAKFTDIFL